MYLDVVRRIPVGVEYNHLVRGSQIEAQAAGTRGDEEHKRLFRPVELVA